jgi:hypothetical protein
VDCEARAHLKLRADATVTTAGGLGGGGGTRSITASVYYGEGGGERRWPRRSGGGAATEAEAEGLSSSLARVRVDSRPLGFAS